LISLLSYWNQHLLRQEYADNKIHTIVSGIISLQRYVQFWTSAERAVCLDDMSKCNICQKCKDAWVWSCSYHTIAVYCKATLLAYCSCPVAIIIVIITIIIITIISQHTNVCTLAVTLLACLTNIALQHRPVCHTPILHLWCL
jgi:hypothetical protein